MEKLIKFNDLLKIPNSLWVFARENEIKLLFCGDFVTLICKSIGHDRDLIIVRKQLYFKNKDVMIQSARRGAKILFNKSINSGKAIIKTSVYPLYAVKTFAA